MKQVIFEIYMTENGPKTESKMDKRLLLRTLSAYLEDLREEVYVDRMKREPNDPRLSGNWRDPHDAGK